MADLPLVQAKLAEMALGHRRERAARLPRGVDQGRRRRARDARGGDGQAARDRERAAHDRRRRPALRRRSASPPAIRSSELYREIRALRIYEGASEVQQLIIGRSVLTKGVGHEVRPRPRVLARRSALGPGRREAARRRSRGRDADDRRPRPGRRQGRLARRLRALDRRLHRRARPLGRRARGAQLRRNGDRAGRGGDRRTAAAARVLERLRARGRQLPRRRGAAALSRAVRADRGRVGGQHGHAPVSDLARGVHQRRRRRARAVVIRPALARAVPLLHRQARSRRVLRVAGPAQLSQLHGGHRAATGRMGLAPAHVEPARALPAGADAGEPRGHVHEPAGLAAKLVEAGRD